MRHISIFFIISFFLSCQGRKYPKDCDEVKQRFSFYEKKATRDSSYKRELLKSLSMVAMGQKCTYSNFLATRIFLNEKDTQSAKEFLISKFQTGSLNYYSTYTLGELFYLSKQYDSATLYFSYAEQLKSNGEKLIVNYTDQYSSILEEPNFEIEYSTIVFMEGVASFHAKYYTNARSRLEYCKANKKHLGEACYYLALMDESTGNLEAACKNMRIALDYVQVMNHAKIFLNKYCK